MLISAVRKKSHKHLPGGLSERSHSKASVIPKNENQNVPDWASSLNMNIDYHLSFLFRETLHILEISLETYL